jgi:ribosomal L4/L1-like protein
LRSPLWKGGGNVHGPQPRDWSYNMPKKMRRGALRSALSERVREGNVIVVEAWSLDKPRTKDFVASLATLGLEGKTLIVDTFDNENLMLSARNLQRAKVVNSLGLNIYDLLYHEKLVLSHAAIEELEQLLGPKAEKVAASDDAPNEQVEAAPATKTKKAAAATKPKRASKPASKAASKPAKAKPKRASKSKKETA